MVVNSAGGPDAFCLKDSLGLLGLQYMASERSLRLLTISPERGHELHEELAVVTGYWLPSFSSVDWLHCRGVLRLQCVSASLMSSGL